MKAYPELTAALREMLDRMKVSLRASDYSGPAVMMYVAGGIAVNYHSGTRYTEDVDAILLAAIRASARTHRQLPAARRRGGVCLFRSQLQHVVRAAARGLRGAFRSVGGDRRRGPASAAAGAHATRPRGVQTRAIFRARPRRYSRAPAEGLISAGQLRSHALEAMGDYIGDKRPLLTSIEIICRTIKAAP